MNAHFDASKIKLSETLLQRLAPIVRIAGKGPEVAGIHMRGRQLFSYCCFETERLARVAAEKPMIGIVLDGCKEFWLGESRQRFDAGDVFVFPAGPEFEAVNIPGERSGLYRSLLVEVLRIPDAVRNAPVSAVPARGGLDMAVPLTPDLVDALVHAAVSLNASDHADTLAEHRLAEVLLLLRGEPAARCLFEAPLADRIGWLVLGDPSRRWTAETIGRELGVGASTLRRRLTEAGTPLRDVLASTRIQLAHGILSRGEGNVTEAAEAAGYISRSHFVRQFRSLYGALPSAVRQTKA